MCDKIKLDLYGSNKFVDTFNKYVATFSYELGEVYDELTKIVAKIYTHCFIVKANQNRTGKDIVFVFDAPVKQTILLFGGTFIYKCYPFKGVDYFDHAQRTYLKNKSFATYDSSTCQVYFE